MPDAKFECSTFSIFWRHDITNFSRNEDMNHQIRSPGDIGSALKNFLCVKLFFSSAIDSSNQFHNVSSRRNVFHFKNFFRYLYEKESGSNPLILQFCQNMSEDKNIVPQVSE